MLLLSSPSGKVGKPLQRLASLGGGGYNLADLRYFRRVAQKINNEYVDPTRVDPKTILRASLDKVARRVPEFLYEINESQQLVKLVVGTESDEFGLPARLEGLSDVVLVIDKVAAFLDSRLSAEVERPPIEYALMNGMLGTLDPHSVYIAPEQYREMSITNKGHFGGLGITIGIREGRLTILYPLKDTPAWRAGLAAGDRIDKIGNESTVNMGLQEAVSKLRGAVGTPITITVSTDDDQPDREVTIVRARIEVPSVESAYAGTGIGIIQLLHFSQTTYETVEDALEVLDSKAVEDKQGQLKGLVLDLRDNPGGYLQQAIEVADKFIASGPLVTTVGLGGSEPDVTRATRFRTEAELPIVVLVDESSASASEIVAGALQNRDRAVVMGARTFGKGSVQNLYDRDFHDGALKMTIAQYLTPGDVSIQGQGVQPDIELRPAVVKEDGQARLYWQDFELREEELPHSFAWGEQESSRGTASLRSVYSCPECFADDKDASSEGSAEDLLDDPDVQAAKAILLRCPSTTRKEMLDCSAAVLSQHFAKREKELETAFESLGIDWSLWPRRRGRTVTAGAGEIVSELTVGSEDGLLVPGTSTEVRLKVTNHGSRVVQRLRAVTRGDFFQGREYFFGRLGPGQTREYVVKAKPLLWADPRAYEVTWHFFAEDGPVPSAFTGRLRIQDVPHPRFAYSWQVVDDGSGSSRGNGDGLIQIEEEIDLLVTVRNIGPGPTAGLWLRDNAASSSAEPQAPDPLEPANAGKLSVPAAETKPSKTKTEDKKRGFIRLKNKSGEAVFLTAGSASFRLRPGEQSHHRLHLRVVPGVSDLKMVELQLVVGDEEFYEVVSSDFEIPLFSPSTEPSMARNRVMKPAAGSIRARGGASELMPEVATISGPVEVTARLGSWYRVALPWSATGWVPASSLVAIDRGVTYADANEAVTDGSVVAFLPNSPPIVQLKDNPGGLVVSADRLKISGEVVDDTEVKDLFLFVNDRKVRYERLPAGSGRYSFSFEVKLEQGENEIEVFARDAADHVGSVTFGVYRENSRASLQVPSSESGAGPR